jgi:very-short-patch-repair endonuclease
MKQRRIIPYNPHLKKLARTLRNHSTLSEVLLWNQLKNKKMLGYDFHRQKPIDEFIIDFFSPELMLAIEIDGDSHWQKYDTDKNRQGRLEALGIGFLRFHDSMIKHDMLNVLRSIEGWIRKNSKKTHP